MTNTIERPLVSALRERLTARGTSHERFVGAPIDIADLQPLELGALWADVRRGVLNPDAPRPAKEASFAVLRQAQSSGLVPALDEDAALAAMKDVEPGQWALALDLLSMLTLAPTPRLAAEAGRVLGEPGSWRDLESFEIHGGVALALVAGRASFDRIRAALDPRASRSPYWRSELDALPELGWESWLAFASERMVRPLLEIAPTEDPTPMLAAEPAFVVHAERVLRQAAAHVAAIHRGEVPYLADGAFTPEDAQAIGRAMRVAASRDEPWLGPVIRQLMPEVCLAPTAAKTVPSQAVAIALGHAIEAMPTPESVEALKTALATVRHAGVAKKLARHVKPAERRLADRPEVALRLTAEPADRKRSAMLATCLEAGLWQRLDLPAAVWRERLADAPGGRVLARALVWVATSPDGHASAFLPAGTDGAPVYADGRPVQLDDEARVSLWHPLVADAEARRRWQAAVVARRLRQPFRQVFREHYVLPPGEAEEADAAASTMFEGHVLSLRPLLGLARKEGWRIAREQGLVREFGTVRATFAVGGRLYPGIVGDGDSGAVAFEHRDGNRWRPCAPGTVDRIVLSEVCRAVDLLVSVAGFALVDGSEDLPPTLDALVVAGKDGPLHPRVARWRRLQVLASHSLGEMALARRDALEHVFADAIADGRMTMSARHLHVGDHAVHLATGRVTRQGEPIELEIVPRPSGRKLAAVPWLPYDEVLLQRIAEAAGTLLAAR